MLSVLTSSIYYKAASNVDELIKITSGTVTDLVPLGATSYHITTLIALNNADNSSIVKCSYAPK